MKVKRESEVAQSCLTPSDPMDCSLPGSSIHGIFQARVLEWGAIAFSVPSLEQLTIITHGQHTTERILEDGSEEEAPLCTIETKMDCVGQVREVAPQCCLFPEAMVLPVVKKRAQGLHPEPQALWVTS